LRIAALTKPRRFRQSIESCDNNPANGCSASCARSDFLLLAIKDFLQDIGGLFHVLLLPVFYYNCATFMSTLPGLAPTRSVAVQKIA
jgi:hypothetical protein